MLFRPGRVEEAAVSESRGIGPATAVGTSPQMPYTQALLSAVPVPHPELERTRQRVVLTGDVPSPAAVPSGCRFRTRCPYVFEPCDDVDPALQPAGAPGQLAACHLHGVVGRPVSGSEDEAGVVTG